MKIKTLSLHNFRNFKQVQKIEFPAAPLLVAAAPNATGKTNFLESLAILLRGKSFRASHAECVSWGEEYFLVQGELEHKGVDSSLSVQYHIPSQELRIEENGGPVSPVTFYSHYPYILFLPEDSFMFQRGPAARRNFLNTTLISSSAYLAAIVQYQRALRQRNAALKSSSKQEDIAAWTDLLVQHAASVWSLRQTFTKYIQTRLNDLYSDLFSEEYSFTVELVPGAADPDNYLALLKEAWPYEQKYRYTLYGPHRDDLQIMIDGRPAAAVLSRGQMRSVIIALKLAAYGFLRQITEREPLVLFDEVLSELDEGRQASLLAHLPDSQILLTCTSLPASIRNQDDVHLLDLRRIIDAGAPAPSAPAGKVTVTEEAEEEIEEKVSVQA